MSNYFWCDVNLKNIENNINVIRDLIQNKKLIAVIKGDAYGLGSKKIAEFIEDKVDIIAVGNIDESLCLDNINKDILILSPLCTKDDFKDERDNLILTLDNEEILNELDKETKKRVHIYVDTGMNRMGIKPNKLDSFIERVKNEFPNLEIDGIYTHLHNAKDVNYTLKQIELFKSTVEKYKDKVRIIHCMASSAIVNDQLRKACDFTTGSRAGNVLYGYIGFNKGIKKTYEYYAKPVNTYKVSKGQTLGYGCLFKADKDMEIGIIECGNVHGLGISREIKNNVFYDIFRMVYRRFKERSVIFNKNVPVKILGKVNMNITIISMENCSKDSVLKVDISPIISDSSIEKRYIY
ncbi:TPA: alanine racemase [Clostridium perfringens]|nr:alanine racemase [Clostridium perfringens]